jgi:pyrimidine operon attenuation protein/uracil phosphoribosyltransferase
MGMPAGYRERQELMDGAHLARTLSRMAHEIAERHPAVGEIVLVGVLSRGLPLARRLASLVREASGREPRVGALDITLYRDDFTAIAPNPLKRGTDIPVSIDGRTVILVDDVLYTGRTARAALDELIDFGRPARIELAVVLDRGHRELPIHADYVGHTLETARDEIVQVLVAEEDGEDRVVVYGRAREPRAVSRKKALPRKPKRRNRH